MSLLGLKPTPSRFARVHQLKLDGREPEKTNDGRLVRVLLHPVIMRGPRDTPDEAPRSNRNRVVRIEVGAAAVPYMRTVGHLVFSYFWARMARIALDKEAEGDPFYKAKLATARFYFAKLLPETASTIRAARAGSKTLMDYDEALF